MKKRTKSPVAPRQRVSILAVLASGVLGSLGCHEQAAPPSNSAAAPIASAPPAESALSAPKAIAGDALPAAPSVVAAPPAPSSPSDAASAAPDELVGKPAPDFTAVAHDGAVVHLAALRGKAVVVYFYPKDETPGCTKEACSFRDAWQPIASTGAVLIGVSADNRASHAQFVQHYKLPFRLISDPVGEIGRAYGVPFTGVLQRQTFVIGADGTVRKVYRHVDVSVHAQQVLADLAHAS